METEEGYLVRFGMMGHVGRFHPDHGNHLALERGQTVVVETDRGIELGEVLLPLGLSTEAAATARRTLASAEAEDPELGRSPRRVSPRLLRCAGPDDLANARACEELRGERYALCNLILGESGWPVELIDVEPLLDRNMTVLHFLGPEDVDLPLLRARLRSRCTFDVIFEPLAATGATRDFEPERASPGGGCGSCSSGGGCGSSTDPFHDADGVSELNVPRAAVAACETASHSACSSCGVAKWRLARQHGQGG
jgi:hypothetical protein